MGRDGEAATDAAAVAAVLPPPPPPPPHGGQGRTTGGGSRPCSSPLAVVTLVMALTLALTLPSSVVALGNDNCQLIPVRTNIIKETPVPTLDGPVPASCSGEVELHKCEGQCESKVIPSVRHARGFRLDCRCCKEEAIVTRTVLLNRCFHNGELLSDTEVLAEVNDLESCSCVSCTN